MNYIKLLDDEKFEKVAGFLRQEKEKTLQYVLNHPGEHMLNSEMLLQKRSSPAYTPLQVAPPARPPQPFAICRTPGCYETENINARALGISGHCCWCCRQTFHNNVHIGRMDQSVRNSYQGIHHKGIHTQSHRLWLAAVVQLAKGRALLRYLFGFLLCSQFVICRLWAV